MIFAILLTTAFASRALAGDADSKKKACVNQIIDHPALNQTRYGIIEGLRLSGFSGGDNLEIEVESAQGSSAIAAQIASKFVGKNCDVVIGLGTVSAQSFLKYAADDKVTLIFSSITDPVRAGLVKSLSAPSRNISGVSNFVDLEPQLELFREIQPNLARLGILYNPGESNSVGIIEQLEKMLSGGKITLTKVAVRNTGEISQTALSLANKVDAIFLSNNNTVLSGLGSVLKAANKYKTLYTLAILIPQMLVP